MKNMNLFRCSDGKLTRFPKQIDRFRVCVIFTSESVNLYVQALTDRAALTIILLMHS